MTAGRRRFEAAREAVWRGALHLRLGAACAIAAIAAAACGGGPPSSSSAPSPSARGQALAPGSVVAVQAEPGIDRASFVVQDGHSGGIHAVALGHDGRVAATVATDRAVRVWDTATGLLLRRIATGVEVPAISLSGDGTVLAYSSAEQGHREIAVVDLASDAPARHFEAGFFELSPDGRALVVSTGAGLARFDSRTGALLGKADVGFVRALAFDPAGRKLAAVIEGEILLLDAVGLAILQRFPQDLSAGPRELPVTVALGEGALVVRTVGGSVHVLGTREGAAAIRLPGQFQGAVPLGGRLLTMGWVGGKMALWELPSGAPLPPPPPPPAAVWGAWASGDASVLALATIDARWGPTVRLQDARSGRTFRVLEGHYAQNDAIAVSPDGSSLATGSSADVLARWDLRTGELVGSAPDGEFAAAQSLDFDPTGASIVATTTGARPVRVRDAKTGRLLRRWSTKELAPDAPHSALLALFLDGHALVTAGSDGVVKRWDLSGAAPAVEEGSGAAALVEIGAPPLRVLASLPFPIRAAARSADGAAIAVAGGDSLALVRADTGAIEWKVAAPAQRGWGRGRWLAFAPGGEGVLLSSEQLPSAGHADEGAGSLRVFNAKTGLLERTLRPDTAGPLATRGNTVAIGGERPVLLGWPAGEARRVAMSGLSTAVAASPLRDLFYFASDGGGTSVVSGATGKVLAVLISTPDGEYVTATPDGVFRASLDGARRVAWSFPAPLEGFSFEQFAVRFDRPDLVARRLAGEETPPPAEVHRPPRVTLDRASVPRATAERAITVRLTAAARSRVERVRVYVNGRPAAEREVGLASARVELSVPLGAGRNRIAVLAYDGEGLASNAQIADTECTSKEAPRPDLWVVSLGVSRYPRLAPELGLGFADDDARAIAALGGKLAGEGRPFGRLHQRLLLDQEVTVDGVLGALRSLSSMRPEDLAVVFFAGHGAKLPGGEMVLLTSAAALTRQSAQEQGIGWSRLGEALAGARGRVVLLLDACHSGHISTDLTAANESLVHALSAESRAGVVVLAASRGSQPSFEVGADAQATRGSVGLGQGGSSGLAPNHGLFTAALLEALSGRAVDRDQSSAIELSELIDYVTERVTDASHGAQTPWVARREIFGDFALAPAKRDAP